MAATPARARKAEEAYAKGIEAACTALVSDFSPISDQRASAWYRLRAAQALLRKFHAGASPHTARHGSMIHEALPHDSAALHVSGEARYVDDLPEPAGTLYAAFGVSTETHAKVLAMDLAPVRAAEGVIAVLAAADIPGANNIGPVLPDEPVLATGVVHYRGQPLFAVAATSVELARRAARLVAVSSISPSMQSLRSSRRSKTSNSSCRASGASAAAWRTWRARCTGSRAGCAAARRSTLPRGPGRARDPGERGEMLVHLHPASERGAALVAAALGVPDAAVTVELRRLGGAFGGKETQAAVFAVGAALLARATGRPVKLRADRDDDIIGTGKRHDFLYQYDVGFDGEGRIEALEFLLACAAACRPTSPRR